MSAVNLGSRRGQSDVLGIVLLFSLVLVVSTTIVVVGNESLNDVKEDISDESAGITMADMQSMIDQSGAADPAVQHVSFAQASGGSDQRSAASSAQLEGGSSVSIVKPGDPESGTLRVEAGGTTIVDRDMGRIVHRKDDAVVAYEGGGVFRQTRGTDSSVLVSVPDFEYKYQSGEPTLSLGITRVSTSSSDVITDDSFSIAQIGPMPGNPIENPISSTDEVTITVESPYYRAWAQLFRDRTRGATITTGDFDGDGMPGAKLVLDGSSNLPPGPVESGVFAGSGSSVSNSVDIDSYRSAAGGYTGTFGARKNGDVSIGRSLTINNNPTIYGDLIVEGDLTTSDNLHVVGHTWVGGDLSTDNQPEYEGPMTVSGDLDVDARYIGNSGTAGEDSVVVGGDLVSLDTHSDVYGSIYVHGTVMDNARTFDVDTVHGSIHSGETIDLYGLSGGTRSASIEGDLISGEDVYVGDGVTFASGGRIDAARDVYVRGSNTKNVDIVAGRDVYVRSDVTIDGDVHAGGDVHVDGTVTGDIVAGGQIDGASGTENGNPVAPRPPTLPSADGPSVPASYSANTRIDQLDSLGDPSNNDNDGSPTDQIQSSNDDCNPCTIGPGDYHVERIDLNDGNGERLVVQTNGKPVNIYVKDSGGNGPVNLRDATIEVQGEGRVQIAVDGGDVMMGSGTLVTTPSDDADQFWIYTQPGAQVTSSGTVSFTGVLYGSDGSGSGTTFSLSDQFEIYGALVGDVTSLTNQVTIHYDESLQEPPTAAGGGSPGDRVGYVHVTTTQVEVTDD